MNELVRTANKMFKEFWPEVYYTYADSQTGFDVPVNGYETANEVVLEAYLPGVKKEDIEISLESGILTLAGKLAVEVPKDVKLFSQEISSGTFTRKIRVGNDLDSSKVYAKMKDGVLFINIQKLEKSKPRKILIDG
jgi:HSP20 family protein